MELLEQYYKTLNNSRRFDSLTLCEKKELFESLGFALFKIEVWTKEAQEVINNRLKTLKKYKNESN